VTYGANLRNLVNATNYVFRRRTHPGGPRHFEKTDRRTAPHGSGRRRPAPGVVRQLATLAMPVWLLAALALVAYRAHALFFAPIVLVLTVRALTARARGWVRVVTLVGTAAFAFTAARIF
jgi:hypothetical protein